MQKLKKTMVSFMLVVMLVVLPAGEIFTRSHYRRQRPAD